MVRQISVKQSRKELGLPEEIPKPIKRTPEEIELAKQEGQAFLSEREKRASQLMEQGATFKQAQEQASREITIRAEQLLTAERLRQEQEFKQAQLKTEKQKVEEEIFSELIGETKQPLIPKELPKETPKTTSEIIKEQFDTSKVFGGIVSETGQPIGTPEVNKLLGEVALSQVGAFAGLRNVNVGRGLIPVSERAIAIRTARQTAQTSIASKTTALFEKVTFGKVAGVVTFGKITGLSLVKNAREDMIASNKLVNEIMQGVKDGVYDVDFANERLIEIFDSIGEIERTIKGLSPAIRILSFGTESVDNVEIDAIRIKARIVREQRNLAKIEAGIIEPENLILALDEINRQEILA